MVREPLMSGFPPPAESRATLANWQDPPYNRWSFQHLRELIPTQRISRGHSPQPAFWQQHGSGSPVLDDVTVSRKHAVVSERDGAFVVEDQGSLNGTFVNRKRVESAQLEDGDELQIGKYRLTFLNR